MEYIGKLLKAVDGHDLYPKIRTTFSAANPVVNIDGKDVVSFCSNNYLGMATNEKVIAAAEDALKKYGTSCGGSRLISGNLFLEEELEGELATFKGTEAAILFMTGLMANTGTIPALMTVPHVFGMPSMKQEDNIILSDELNHASIVDGVRLSKAEHFIYKHKDIGDLEKLLKKHQKKRKLIVSDGVFSMDGDIAPLPKIMELAERYGAIVMIDDAHATGILGKNGRGTAEHFGLEGKVPVIMGTLSKAFGGVGGFVAGSNDLIRFLRIRARDYIFSSALPPATAAGLIAAVKEVRSNPGIRESLWQNVRYLKNGLEGAGFNILGSETQIMPIHIGDEKKAFLLAEKLFDEGIFLPAVYWPAVPEGKARLRCTAMATHTKEQIDMLLAVLQRLGKELRII